MFKIRLWLIKYKTLSIVMGTTLKIKRLRANMEWYNTITKKGGGLIARNYHLSALDKSFLNNFYLPYIARTDLWMELDKTVFYNGRILTESERLQLQRQMNEQRGLYGEPPASGRIERQPW